MKIARIPLKEFSRFHFGEFKMDENLALSTSTFFAHSDTLFSALVTGYSRFTGDADDFVMRFENEEIKISSLFYYLKSKDEYIYFLPKPDFLAIYSPKSEDGLHKKRNRIKFVSRQVWENGFDAELWFDKNKYRIIQEEFVVTEDEFDLLGLDDKTIIAKQVMRPKSPMRVPEDMKIHYQTDVEIGNNNNLEIGWYFAYEAENNAEIELFIATNIMAYTGIGGEIYNTGRTIKSKPEFDNLTNFDFEDSEKWINISLINPVDDAEFSKIKYYSTMLRGGRKVPSGNAKVVKMVKEGALIDAEDVRGRLVDLGIDINEKIILRNGISLLIPVKYEF